VVVTADTDFGTLLARSGRPRPSVILVRELLGLSVDAQGRMIAANLEQIRPALTVGAVVVLGLDDIRVRPLPIL
jgi:predicted nuclease of predicted toxin-antitoxin system